MQWKLLEGAGVGGLLEGAVERLGDTYKYVGSTYTPSRAMLQGYTYIYPFHIDLPTQVKPESNLARFKIHTMFMS